MTADNFRKQSLLSALFSGLIPHLFCILFLLFAALGTTAITALIKPLLLSSGFFYFLIFASLLFATISAIIYLKRCRFLSWQGVRKKWRYLSLLYLVTVTTNLVFFLIIFPKAANLDFNKSQVLGEIDEPSSSITVAVEIPCSGHAPLIINEIEKTSGIKNVIFSFPNLFKIIFLPQQITPEKILSLPIFNNFPAKLQ